MKTIEYLLWNNCNNNCLFCNMKYKYQSTEEDKLKAIELVKEDINKQQQPFNVLLVGGEIFDNITDKIRLELYKLYDEIFCNNLINIIYINTNLLYYVPDCLEKILNKAPLERIHLTTSDDIWGRFKTEEDFKLFFNNIDYLKFIYPNLNLIVNMILTKPFCKMVKDGKFNIKDYCNKYKVKVNIIPYIDVNNIKELKSTRQEVLDALLILKEQYKDWFDGYLDIMTKKEDMELLQYNPKINKLDNMTADKNNCGHSANFTKCFSDSDLCYGCFLENLR